MGNDLSRLARGIGSTMLGAAVLLSPVANAALVKAVEYVGDHVFLTAHPAEIDALDSGRIPGWTRSGLELWVHDTPGVDLVPVCRFYSAHFAPHGLHFLTAFADECEALKTSPVWIEEGIAFHASLPTPLDGGGAACEAGSFPIHRWYNNGQGGVPRHAFTPYRESGDPLARVGGYAQNGWTSEGMGYVAWAPVGEDDFFTYYYGQDGIAFCTFASSPGGTSFDLEQAVAGGLALVLGTRWTLQSAQRGAFAMEFAGEIVEQSGYRQLRVTVGERTGTASWIGSHGQLGMTLVPPGGNSNLPFQMLYLTFTGRNATEGCLYEQSLPWSDEGFKPCERVVATRH